VRFVEIFGDDPGARDRRKAFGHQDRRGGRGIEQEKPFTPLPGPLLHQAQVEAVFAQREANEARMRAERMMIERVHEIPEVKSRRLKEPSNRVKRIGTLAKQTRETMVF